MLRTFFLLWMVLFSTLAFSEEGVIPKSVEDLEDYSTLIDFEGMPSTIVGGCVNVITGHYFETEDDLVTPGPNPVTLTRFFNGHSKLVGDLYDLWSLNLSERIKIEKEGGTYARVREGGSETLYYSSVDCSPRSLEVHSKVLKKGVVNFCSPYLSGRHHLINKRVYPLGGCAKGPYIVDSPGLQKLRFEEMLSSYKYLLTEVLQSTGCKLFYSYEDSKACRLGSYSADDRLVGEIAIEREAPRKFQKILRVKANDGKELTYTLSRMSSKHKSSGKHRYCLTSVEKNFGPTVKYSYNSSFIPKQLQESVFGKEKVPGIQRS